MEGIALSMPWLWAPTARCPPQIAGDPHGFILRQGWASLDFRDEEQTARLRKLWESLELEILRVLEATNRLRESPEPCQCQRWRFPVNSLARK